MVKEEGGGERERKRERKREREKHTHIKCTVSYTSIVLISLIYPGLEVNLWS